MSEADYYRRCPQKGFLKLDPNIRPAICRNKNLGRLEYDVYICLLHHLNKEEGRCNPSNELIAWELGYASSKTWLYKDGSYVARPRRDTL